MNTNNYIVYKIGEIITDSSKTMAIIDADYKKALKNLGKYSHIIIVTCLLNNSELNHNPIFRPNLNKNHKLLPITVQVEEVNETQGTITLNKLKTITPIPIYDIKPYFPVEDRIEDVQVDKSYSSKSNWLDNPTYPFEKNFNNLNLNTSEYKEITLNSIGNYIKQNQKDTLILNETETSIIKSIKTYSHIRVIWWFNRFEKDTFRKTLQVEPPYEGAQRSGVFATRSPVRKNPLAISTVKIDGFNVEAGEIYINGFDAFNNTPILDILPYIPHLDRVNNYCVPEWVKHWPQWKTFDSDHTNDKNNTLIFKENSLLKYKQPSTYETRKEAIPKIKEEIDINNIVVTGAKHHNLKNIHVKIPKNKLTIITGLSGSGKSTLAFDTIYAEAQRRYTGSLNIQARTGQELEKPDVESIKGLSPAIAIEQNRIIRNPRSTVGTVTDIYNYLRILYTKIGLRYCPTCRELYSPMKPYQLSRTIKNFIPETHVDVIVKDESNQDKTLFSIEVTEKIDSNLTSMLEEAYKQGDGIVFLKFDDGNLIRISNQNTCQKCGNIFFDLRASYFSYNSPDGMCKNCNGLGFVSEPSEDTIIKDANLSLLDGASDWWGKLRDFIKKPTGNWMKGEVIALSQHLNIDLELPWKELPEDFRNYVLYGYKKGELTYQYNSPTGRKGEIKRPCFGAIAHIKRLLAKATGNSLLTLKQFIEEKPCPSCKGERLALEGRSISILKTRYPEAACMSINMAFEWICVLEKNLDDYNYEVSKELLSELKNRLTAIINVGLEYITLDRPVTTLSGGEMQRLLISTRLNCGLSDLLYVLDEPSKGLHPADYNKIKNTLLGLKQSGNTLIVVEHQKSIIKDADYIIDMGPGAGYKGGEILATGSPNELKNQSKSITGKYIKGNNIFLSKQKRKLPTKYIEIKRATLNNLKAIDVKIPLGMLVCITGVSGSGKSSLISDLFAPAVSYYIKKKELICDNFDNITGLKNVKRIVDVNQSPIGKTPRSNPATYTGIFDEIRKVFASQPLAVKRKYKENVFSFNSKAGCCPACGGMGKIKLDMNFMSDIWINCEECRGKRYKPEILEVLYKNKNINDVLNMEIEEAVEFFVGNNKIHKMLKCLDELGLGYLKLGQSSDTLSGGEAQRIKLASEIGKSDSKNTLYILDEPTSGLHFEDIKSFMKMTRKLIDNESSVILIEHNPNVIYSADWIIDMGPEGGDNGGYIVAEGSPEEIMKNKNSYTGKCLKSNLL